MTLRKLAILLTLASSFAMGTALAQESDDSSGTEGAQTDRQRPAREPKRPRRENMTDEQRAAARERWQGMSDSERKAKRDKMRARHGGKDGQHRRGQRDGAPRKGERPPKAETDAV